MIEIIKYKKFIFGYSKTEKNRIIKEISFIHEKNTEFNIKSAPSILKFLANSLYYLISILRYSFNK